MTTPVVAFRCFILACLLGAGLGIVYDFLRPLRPKYTHLSDLLFVAVAFWVWLYLSFDICDGDLRIGYTAGLFAGCLIWILTFGKLLRPVFAAIWKGIGKFFHALLLPFKIFLKKTAVFANFLFASAKKWGTIKCNDRRRKHRKTGGIPYGKETEHL